MKDELLTEEEKEAYALVINTIKSFEAGDESLEDDILCVIEGIYKFLHFSKKIEIRYKAIITFYKTISRVMFGDDALLQDAYKSVDENYSFYTSARRVLKRYMDVGEKTDNYPDLEAAYTLTIYLTLLEYNMNDYLNEVSLYESSLKGHYNYFGKPYLKDHCEERKEIVKKLVDSINPDGEYYEI